MASRSNLPAVVAAKRIEGNNKYIGTTSTIGLPSAWFQIISATTGPSRFITLTLTTDPSSAGIAKIEVGIGAGGAEVPVLDVLLTGDSVLMTAIMMMPLDASLIPQGSRVSIRATNTTQAFVILCRVGVYLGETA
jgi:hypothetical protein